MDISEQEKFEKNIECAIDQLRSRGYQELKPLEPKARWFLRHAGRLSQKRFGHYYSVCAKNSGETQELVGFLATEGRRSETCFLVPMRASTVDIGKASAPQQWPPVSLQGYLDGQELFPDVPEHPVKPAQNAAALSGPNR